MFRTRSARASILLFGAAIAVALVVGNDRGYGPSNGALVALAIVLLFAGAIALRRQPAGPLRDLAVPASVSTALPLISASAASIGGAHGPMQSLAWIVGAAAAGVLGFALADRMHGAVRQMAMVVAGGLTLTAAVVGVLPETRWGEPPMGSLLFLAAGAAVAGATVVPGLGAAVQRYRTKASGERRQAIVHAFELGLIGLTPAVSVGLLWGYDQSTGMVLPLIIWIALAVTVHQFAVRPLEHSAAVAATQRDLVVTAMESERSRIAADIHDDALQHLMVLAWQLDSAGNAEAAAEARAVAERLRAICGDLRLPMLDDLGAGAALEWLVERISQLANGEVRLERGDQARPPAEVELAFFRVAQEALSNAVRHGRPPIVVRYSADSGSASLAIEDAGGGFDATRSSRLGEGHFGLLNMKQRAERIGALLEVRPWPAGGTQVRLEWRAV